MDGYGIIIAHLTSPTGAGDWALHPQQPIFTGPSSQNPSLVRDREGNFVVAFRFSGSNSLPYCPGNGSEWPVPPSPPSISVEALARVNTPLMIAWAPSMAGPWALENMTVVGDYPGVWHSNPSIWELPKPVGSARWGLGYRYNQAPPPGGSHALGDGEERIGIALADGIKGPWRWLANITLGSPLGVNEDPFLFQLPGQDNYAHILYHNWVDPPPANHSAPYAGGHHAWGPLDRSTPWRTSVTLTFPLNATLEDGTVLQFERRERPWLRLDANGHPVELVTGVLVGEGDAAIWATFSQPVASATDRGSGSVPPSSLLAVYPPTDSSWVRAPAPGVPVLSASLPWEGACVCENVALWNAATAEFVMFYRGGWGTQMVGRATSKDALSWVKHATPVYASDGKIGGEPWVHRDHSDLNGTLLLYTTNNNPPHVYLATSVDGGFTWADEPRISISLPPTGTLWGNRVTWREGGVMFMLQEVLAAGPWQIFLANSSDGGLAWSWMNEGAPLRSLQLHAGGMYGGPRFASVDGTLTPRWARDGKYHLWMHATNASGGLPTDVYHATSEDLLQWAVTPGPAVQHLGGGSFEHDQCAGPVPLSVGGRAYLFYDGDNNNVGSCAIGLVTAAAV